MKSVKYVYIFITFLILCPSMSHSADPKNSENTDDSNLLTVGLGWYDQALFDANYARKMLHEPNFQLGYRLSTPEPTITLFNNYSVTLKSWFGAGIELTNSEQVVYGMGEVQFDVPFSSFTPRFQTGFYRSNNDSNIVFRSQLSLDYYFEEQRFSLSYNYVSNDRLYNGATTGIFSINYHLPIDWFFNLE